MESARVKLKKSIKGRRNSLLKKADELHILCGSPVCIILFKSSQSSIPKTYPPESDKVCSIIANYKKAIASRRPSKNATINLTLPALRLSPPSNKVWENKLPPRILAAFSYRQLAEIDEKIDATLRKIDDKIFPTNLEALVSEDVFGAFCSANPIQMLSAYDLNAVSNNVNDANQCYSYPWEAQNQDLFPSSVMNMAGLLNDRSHFDPSGSSSTVGNSSMNSYDDLFYLFHCNPSNDQLSCGFDELAGNQLQMVPQCDSSAFDSYIPRMLNNGDGDNFTMDWHPAMTGIDYDIFNAYYGGQ